MLLFERRAFAASLARLEALAGRLHRADAPWDTRAALLLELYYHEAICLRKLGRQREAAAVLTSLWRCFPDQAWGRLARARLTVAD